MAVETVFTPKLQVNITNIFLKKQKLSTELHIKLLIRKPEIVLSCKTYFNDVCFMHNFEK